MEKNKKRHAKNAYSLWRVNGCQQGFRSVASFGFGGRESASKPPQAICKPLGFMQKETMKHLIWTITLVFSLAMASCQTDLDMNDIIDQNSSFTLTIMTVDKETGRRTSETEEIEVNSEKWNKLIDFAKNNMDDWQSSPASYIGDIYVTQNDFRLIHTKGTEGVVIAFTDKEGEPRQYTRSIEKGDLDFLTE